MPKAVLTQRLPGDTGQEVQSSQPAYRPHHHFQAGTALSRATRKTHVVEASVIATSLSRCIADVERNGNQGATEGVLDVYALIEEAKRKGIDLTRHQSNQELYHGPNIRTQLEPSFFTLGKIIDIPHPVPNLDSSIASADMNAVWSKLGPLTCKRRPAVIVAAYRDRCKVLPMYTHGKRGVENKPQHIKELALCVVPRGARSGLPSSRTLWCNHLPYDQVDGESYIYPTDSYCVNHAWPVGTRDHGHLDAESLRRLLCFYTLYQEAGSLPIAEQATFVRNKCRN